MSDKSVIYVNFSPYDNTGRTLDFLIENYSFVAHFSFDHLRLKNDRRAHLSIYVKGKCVGQQNLSWLKTHPILLFPSLPIVAIAMFVETFWYSYLISKQIGKFDTYLTVNAFPAVTGIILKKLGIVKRTVFWVWDYFPTNFPDWRMKLIRIVYLYFDKAALEFSDKVVYLNNFLRKSRRVKASSLGNKNSIIPIGTDPRSFVSEKRNIVGHMGLIKESQGLAILFDNLEEFFKKFPDYTIEIIGTGPEVEKYIRQSKKYYDRIKFYGFMEQADTIDALICKWKVGLATYIPTTWSEHYWGDPSKIKAYIANGVPVVTTSVPEFSHQLKINHAGLVIPYDKNALFSAINTVIKRNEEFSKNAIRLSKEYYYKKIYKQLLK
ncbi:MAG: glycosyltransferase [Candidatus Levybacteria bacterium]|nr:glycosyltransferase [Candidatus Levybacteria bacterium]